MLGKAEKSLGETSLAGERPVGSNGFEADASLGGK